VVATDAVAPDRGPANPGTGKMGTLKFRRQTLHTQNLAEAINTGDFNKDGKPDVVSGPYWWEGPTFLKRHEYFPAPPSNSLTGGSLYDWADHPYDVDGDGWTDIIIVERPGTTSYWYQNPGAPANAADSVNWSKHAIGTLVLEQSALGDLSGDGKPDLVAARGGQLGWFEIGTASPWPFHAVTPPGPWSEWWHGLGIGDVDGDGKLDLLESTAWWARAGDASAAWTRRPQMFKGDPADAASGGSFMYAYDVDGDGDNDVVTSLNAHGWGLAWFEQTKAGGAISFTKHTIIGTDQEKAMYGGLAISQMHALCIADMDGDGLTDIVTGKSFYAHAPAMGDPDTNGTPVIYVFKLVRGPAGVSFKPFLVDSEMGLGKMFAVADLNGDGLIDIMSGGKHGAFLFMQE
jgi:hypothetical protein